MTSFNISLPADPKWLHVARSAALAGVTAMPTAHVDFLDDATLAVGESVLEVAVAPGVDRLSVLVETSERQLDVTVVGSGSDIDLEDAGEGDVFRMVLEGLADEIDTESSDSTYVVRFSMSAPAA